jgi:hypothetical protein
VERDGGYRWEEWKIEIPEREKVKGGGSTTLSTPTSITKSFN